MNTNIVSKKMLLKQFKDASVLESRISFHERFSANPYGWHRWVFDQFNLPPNAKVLELGSGLGKLWVLNANRISRSWQITLTDISPEMLSKAKRNTLGINANFSYELVDAINIPFRDNQFDIVIANHFLYLITDKEERAQTLSGISRVLTPTGKFYASTNGLNHMCEIVRLVKEFDRSIPFISELVQHFSLESGPIEISSLFNNVTVHYYDDALVIENIEMLLDFVLSSITMNHVKEERKADLRKYLKKKLCKMKNGMRVQKNMGIICAS